MEKGILFLVWNVGEEGVKGDLITYVQITFYISMSFKDLHASVTIVKNILN